MFNTFFTVILSIQVTFLFHFVGTLQSPSHCATVKNLILFLALEWSCGVRWKFLRKSVEKKKKKKSVIVQCICSVLHKCSTCTNHSALSKISLKGTETRWKTMIILIISCKYNSKWTCMLQLMIITIKMDYYFTSEAMNYLT